MADLPTAFYAFTGTIVALIILWLGERHSAGEQK